MKGYEKSYVSFETTNEEIVVILLSYVSVGFAKVYREQRRTRFVLAALNLFAMCRSAPLVVAERAARSPRAPRGAAEGSQRCRN